MHLQTKGKKRNAKKYNKQKNAKQETNTSNPDTMP